MEIDPVEFGKLIQTVEDMKISHDDNTKAVRDYHTAVNDRLHEGDKKFLSFNAKLKGVMAGLVLIVILMIPFVFSDTYVSALVKIATFVIK